VRVFYVGTWQVTLGRGEAPAFEHGMEMLNVGALLSGLRLREGGENERTRREDRPGRGAREAQAVWEA
jgi:hypothetical protein